MLRTFLEQVVHRQELGMKYTSFEVIRKANEAIDNRWREKERKEIAKPRAIPTTADELLVLNANDHLQAIGPAAGYITMPDRPDSGLGFQVSSLMEDDVEQEGDEGEDDAAENDVAADSEEGLVPKRRRIDEDAIVPAEEDMESGEILTCFKVLKSRPGGMKSLSTFIEKGGSRLSSSTFAVTFHSYDSCQETGALIVDDRPRAVGVSGMRAMVVEEFRPQCSLQTLCDSVHGHANDGPPSLRLSLPIRIDGSQLDLHPALNNMLQARAVVGRDDNVEGDVALWPWASLVESGFVKVLSTDDLNTSRRLYLYVSCRYVARSIKVSLAAVCFTRGRRNSQVSIGIVSTEELENERHVHEQASSIQSTGRLTSGKPLCLGVG